MIWGLLPNDGTSKSPHLHPSDDNFTPSPHYIMFNARSETIDTKKSFHNLLRDGNTCILAVDGYYEWTKSLSPMDKKKQPYFIRASSASKPLLLAGLWTQVKTGTLRNNQEETISTFTILTTEAHPKYAWLHPRQPVILHYDSLAREWLMSPSKDLVDKIRSFHGGLQNDNDPWETEMIAYPVTKKISDTSYQGDDCTVEVKSKVRNLDSYFGQNAASPRQSQSDKRQKVDEEGCSKASPLPQKNSDNMDPEWSQKHDSSDWSCLVCTFRHSGSKSHYLVCDMCGSKKECIKDSAGLT